MRGTVFGKPTYPLKPMAATSVSSVLIASPGNTVTVSWVNPPANNYDTILVERNSGAGYVTVANPVKGTTSFVDTAGYSLDHTYRVTPLRNGWTIGPQVTSTVRTTPQVPSLAGFWRGGVGGPGAPGALYTYYLNPGHANIAGFDVAISNNNGSSWGTLQDAGFTSPWPISGALTGSSSYRGRARTRDTLGQVSAWNEWAGGDIS